MVPGKLPVTVVVPSLFGWMLAAVAMVTPFTSRWAPVTTVPSGMVSVSFTLVKGWPGAKSPCTTHSRG